MALSLALPAFAALEEDNPYLSIIERNPFGLKPPPDPTPADAAATAVTPPAKVTLTGLITIFGEPRALLEVTETEGGKPGPAQKLTMRLGERVGSVELVAIDMGKNQARILNGPVETNLTFELAKATGPAAPPPGGALPGLRPAMPFPGMPTPLGAANPNMPTAAAQSGSGITLLGGGNTTPSNPAATAVPPPPMPTINGLPSGTQPGAPTFFPGDTRSRALPTRRILGSPGYPIQPSPTTPSQ